MLHVTWKFRINIPKHRVHRYVDKLLYGTSFPEVHRAIDRPYVFLGRKHRKMFHTPKEAYIMGSSASLDSRAGLAGLTHAWVDRECSRNKSLKKLPQLAAHQDYI